MDLTFLNLDESKIEHVPDLSGVPNLETLSFQGCENLTEVHVSIGFLKKLRYLRASNCSKLKSFPALMLPLLEELELDLSSCSSLENFPKSSIANLSNLTSLTMGVPGMLWLPNSIVTLPYLKHLDIRSPGGLQVPKQEEDEGKGSSMVSTSLKTVCLEYCKMSDESIRILLPWFCNAVELYLCGNDFTILQESMKELCSLTDLILDDCKKLREIRGIPPNIEELWAANCMSLTRSCRSMLLNEEYHGGGAGYKKIHLPGGSIPKWLEHVNANSISFWWRKNISPISLCVILGSEASGYTFNFPWPKCNGNIPNDVGSLFTDALFHVMDHITIVESHSSLGDELLSENEWNHVVRRFSRNNTMLPMKEFGIHEHKHESNTEDIRFTHQRGDLDPITLIQDAEIEEIEGVNWKREEAAAGPSSGVKQEIPQNPNEAFHHEEEEEEGGGGGNDDHKNTTFVPGPLLPLEDQIERHKEDESLRTWKEKLLESDLDGQVDPEVKFHSIGIISKDLDEIVTPLPLDENQNGRALFSLKEGSCYQLKLKFSVLHNIVSGLRYSNTVWTGGLQAYIDQTKGMLGTFAPQKEPYIHALKEEVTPSGLLARGVYSAKLKFEDDDGRCHMELRYSFEIKKSS